MPDPNIGFNPINPLAQANMATGNAPHPDLQRPPVGAPGGPAPQQAQPVQPPPPAEPPGTRIPLDFDEYKRLTGLEKEYQEMLRQQQQELEAKEEERLKALAAKGNLEEAFGTYKSNYETKVSQYQELLTQRENAWLGAEKNRVISEVLASIQLVGEDPSKTAKMVRRLLEDEVEAVIGKDGLPVIRDKERGRPALDFLKERLDSPDFAPFIAAKSRGGAGTDGTRSQAAPQRAPDGPPKEYSEKEAIQSWQRSQGIPAWGIHRIPRSG